MMHKISFPFPSIGKALFLAFLATAVVAAPARADFYGYAEQSLSNFNFTGVTTGTRSTGSSSSAVQSALPGGSEAHIAVEDALQSYVGPTGTRPAENTFTAVGLVNPNYVRGDALITPTYAINNVAEGYLIGAGQSSGSGAWSIAVPITLSATGTVTLDFNYSNLIHILNSGTLPGSVTASYAFDFSISRTGGGVLFDSSPDVVNASASLTSAGEIFVPVGGGPSAGTVSITSTSLTAGTYEATLTGSERVFLNARAVPEPSTLILLGLGGVGLMARRMRQISRV